MSASTAPQAKRAILDLLEAHAPLDGVVKRWAGPTKENQIQRDNIWFGKVVRDQEWGSLGHKAAAIKPQRKEDYTIKLVVYVLRDGDDPEQTEMDCYAHVEAIQDVLRTDPDLGGLLSQWAEISHDEVETLPASTRGWMAEAKLDVRCVARF